MILNIQTQFINPRISLDSCPQSALSTQFSCPNYSFSQAGLAENILYLSRDYYWLSPTTLRSVLLFWDNI
jgi:hypothetical protein